MLDCAALMSLSCGNFTPSFSSCALHAPYSASVTGELETSAIINARSSRPYRSRSHLFVHFPLPLCGYSYSLRLYALCLPSATPTISPRAYLFSPVCLFTPTLMRTKQPGAHVSTKGSVIHRDSVSLVRTMDMI